MRLIDSSIWLEYFMNGPLAERAATYLSKPDSIITPSIVLYEVYRKVKIETNEEQALTAASQIEKTRIICFSEMIAYHAADISIQYKLPMADAIVYATADIHKARLVTSDSDFQHLPKVDYLNPEH